MVTALPRLLLAAWNTFVLDEHARRPVPGMAVFLTKLADRYPDAPVVYLSTGPWNVAPTLERFLSRHMFPRGPLLLTDWGATPERFFRSGREHKVTSLDRLVTKFPNIKWVLIGDDGQHDETTYGDFARRHPDNVLGVGIRRLSRPEAVLAGAPISHPEPVPGLTWVYGHNGAELAEKFSAAGLLGGPTPAT
jgi:phosphatidate phosphatase APP1